MISIDTWAVIAVLDDTVTLECPFLPGETMQVPAEEIGVCDVGDILSTETGGWAFLRCEELRDLSEEGRKIFFDFIREKGFWYDDPEQYGFLAGHGE